MYIYNLMKLLYQNLSAKSNFPYVYINIAISIFIYTYLYMYVYISLKFIILLTFQICGIIIDNKDYTIIKDISYNICRFL